MNGFIPSLWTLSNKSSLSTWQKLSGAELAEQLKFALGDNPNMSSLLFTDQHIELMSADELHLVEASLTGKQRIISVEKLIDCSDI
jgi:hypothetical protein